MKTSEMEQGAEKVLLKCLAEVPFLKVEQVKQEFATEGGRPDFLIELTLPDGRQMLVCEVKNSGQPAIARVAINQILRYLGLFPDAYGVFVAPYISPQAARICTEEGVGYVDLAGNCRLAFGQVFIQQEGKPNPFAQKRDLRSLYSPKAARVLRVMLNNPGRRWKLQPLADEAQVSLGQAANVKRLLLDRECIRAEPEGIAVSEPQALLTEWGENYNYRRHQISDFYSLKTVAEIEAALAETCRQEGIKYALTGFSGAARVAPFVRYQRVTAYVQGDIEGLAQRLGLSRVSSGANVGLWMPYDEGVFYATQDYDGARVVSPIQLYLDLRGSRGRGEEAADFLWEQVIKPQW